MPAPKILKKWSLLTPHKDPSANRWIVSLGSIDGVRRRKYFRSRVAALEFCAQEKIRKKAHGEITGASDGVLVSQLLNLNDDLEKAGVNFDLVRHWVGINQDLAAITAPDLLAIGKQALVNHKAIKVSGSVQECFTAYQKFKSQPGKSRGKSRADSRTKCGHFIKWVGEKLPMADIVPEVVADYLAKNPAKHGYFATISAWMGWAAKNKWLAANPCAGLKPESSNRGSVVTLLPNECAQLLRRAVERENWAVLSYLVLSIFSGIRPAEFRKISKGDIPQFLNWSDISADHITISSELSKTGRTGRGRLIELDPVLKIWIKFIINKIGIVSGPVLPSNWVKLWGAWRLENAPNWHQDILRHTFASYHLARSGSLEITSRILGNSPTVLQKNYWNWKTQVMHAEIFWNLEPEIVLSELKIDVAI